MIRLSKGESRVVRGRQSPASRRSSRGRSSAWTYQGPGPSALVGHGTARPGVALRPARTEPEPRVAAGGELAGRCQRGGGDPEGAELRWAQGGRPRVGGRRVGATAGSTARPGPRPAGWPWRPAGPKMRPWVQRMSEQCGRRCGPWVQPLDSSRSRPGPLSARVGQRAAVPGAAQGSSGARAWLAASQARSGCGRRQTG
jgi:hypothetical protein